MTGIPQPERVALIADVHGNLPALEVALEDMAQFGVEDVICLGDLANHGPQPSEALQTLRKLDPVTIMGNTDALLLAERDGSAPLPETAPISRWCAAQLSDADLAWLRTFASMRSLTISGIRVTVYHGSPRSFDERITATTPDEELDRYLDTHTASLYIGAHTHEQFVRRYRGAIIANPGSVGKSFTAPGDVSLRLAVAEYALLEIVNGQPNLHLRRLPYSFGALESAVRASGMPQQDEWLAAFAAS